MFTEKKNLGSSWETRIAGLREARRGAILPPPLFPASKKESDSLLFFVSIGALFFSPKRADTPFFRGCLLLPVQFSLKNGHRGSLGLSLAKRRVLTASPCRGSSPAWAQGYTGAPCFPSAPPEDTPDPVRSPGSLFQRCCNTSSMEVPQAWQGP